VSGGEGNIRCCCRSPAPAPTTPLTLLLLLLLLVLLMVVVLLVLLVLDGTSISNNRAMCRFHRLSSKDGTPLIVDWGTSAKGTLLVLVLVLVLLVLLELLLLMLLLVLLVSMGESMLLKRKGILLSRMPCIQSSC